MIEPLLLIGGFFITLLVGLSSIWQIRGYLRTGLKTYLYWAISALVCLVFFLGMIIWVMTSDSLGRYFGETLIIIMPVLYLIVFYLNISGDSLLLYDQRAAWEQMWEKTTCWQRLTGNVPILEHQKPRPLPISKRRGLVLGIFSTTLGTILIVTSILFKFSTVFIHSFAAAIVVLILGLLLIIFSIVCLEKNNKHSG